MKRLAAYLVLALFFAGRAWSQTEVPDTTLAVAADTTVVAVADSVLVEPVVTADDIIAYARTFIGTPYKLGASGPKMFDCSSFTHYVFKHFGYELTAYSAVQFCEGRPVESYFALQKGDLVFFGKKVGVRAIGHVGIVVSVDREKGSFTFIHASSSRGVIEQSSSHPYFMMRYMGARRILPDEE